MNQFVGDFLCLYLGAAEDDGEDARVVVHDTFQCQVFVLGIHHIVDMVDVLSALVAAAHHDFLVVVQVVAGDGLDFLAHCGREKQRVAVGGHTFEYLVDALRESHVEHLVGLVEHHIAHFVEVCHATVHQVDESAGCGNDDLHAFFQGVDLVDNRGAAVDGHHPYAFHVFREILEVVGDLQTQFTCRADNHCLCLIACSVDFL